MQDLPILLCFEDWQFRVKFDTRGRAYPNPSTFNHLHPILKFFFGFSYKHKKFNPDTKTRVSLGITMIGMIDTMYLKVDLKIPEDFKYSWLKLKHALSINKKKI